MSTAAGWAGGRLVAAALLAVFAGACGTSGVMRPSTDVEAEVRELRQRVVEMQRQATVNQLAIDELRAQVASLEAALGVRRGSPSATRPASPAPGSTAPAPRATRPSAPPAEPAPVRDDDLESEDLDEPAVPVTRPVTTPPTVPPPPADRPPAATTRPSPSSQLPGSAPSTIPAAGQALYDRGYTLYHQGRYVDAEASFQRFLQAHGDSDLGDNAQYWIGEARYARGDYRGALSAFQETASRYPQGNKVPDALLKAGQSLEQLGDPEGARAAYRTVVDRFAASAAAVAAEERLAALR